MIFFFLTSLLRELKFVMLMVDFAFPHTIVISEVRLWPMLREKVFRIFVFYHHNF